MVANGSAEFTDARTACLATRCTARTARMVQQPIGARTPMTLQQPIGARTRMTMQATAKPF